MFHGNILRKLSQLAYLQLLDLADNNLTGSIPTEFANLTSMRQQITEQLVILVEYSTQYPYFGRVDIKWKGHDEIFQRTVSLVTGMDLSSNFLTGEIPGGLSNLQRLKFLNVSRNYLSGSIPKGIGDLKFLESLDISWNQLSGTIPSSIPSMYANNSGLCGFPLGIACPGDSKSVPASDEQKEYHKDLEELWLCYWIIAGFIFGIWLWLGVLVFLKPWRVAIFKCVDRMLDIVTIALCC
jgi:Leucine-rich repeat (LRR) protein